MNPLGIIRERAGYRQIDIANILKIAQSTVSMWESGYSFPHAERLSKLASHYKVSEGEIISAIMAAKEQTAV